MHKIAHTPREAFGPRGPPAAWQWRTNTRSSSCTASRRRCRLAWHRCSGRAQAQDTPRRRSSRRLAGSSPRSCESPSAIIRRRQLGSAWRKPIAPILRGSVPSILKAQAGQYQFRDTRRYAPGSIYTRLRIARACWGLHTSGHEWVVSWVVSGFFTRPDSAPRLLRLTCARIEKNLQARMQAHARQQNHLPPPLRPVRQAPPPPPPQQRVSIADSSRTADAIDPKAQRLARLHE